MELELISINGSLFLEYKVQLFSTKELTIGGTFKKGFFFLLTPVIIYHTYEVYISIEHIFISG